MKPKYQITEKEEFIFDEERGGYVEISYSVSQITETKYILLSFMVGLVGASLAYYSIYQNILILSLPAVLMMVSAFIGMVILQSDEAKDFQSREVAEKYIEYLEKKANR